jgi:hypothetical protein
MQQARARFEREYEPEAPRRRFVALDGGDASVGEREREPFEIDDFDDVVGARPDARTGARRPAGAAASYARGATDGRRTIRIGGHGAQTALRPTPSELRGPRPDRLAAWAVGFGIFVAILAAVTGGA